MPNANTFLYNTGPILNIDDPTWNRPQFYSVTRIQDGRATVLGENLPVPPVNVGKRSTPELPAARRSQAIHDLGRGRTVFAGQRADAFHVDLGSIFDLGALRPFNQNAPHPAHQRWTGSTRSQSYNVHTIALQVPIRELTRDRSRPRNVNDPEGRDRRVGDRQPTEVADL